jgi:hypothetical protein
MPIEAHAPMFIGHRLGWGIHTEDRQTTFWVSATTFKCALGLRPRARADDAKAKTIAHNNWAVLELIARDALRAGRIVRTDASKGWQVHHTIDDSVFCELLDRYGGQIVR